MLRRIFPFLLASVLMTGCFRSTVPNEDNIIKETAAIESETASTETDLSEGVSYPELYRDVLDEFYEIITENKESTVEGTMGVSEQLVHLDSAAALERIGYGIIDISKDGIPELVIGSVSPEGEMALGTMIYAVYTVSDGKPTFVFEGRTKHSFRPMTDGGIFYQGSDGAMYSVFGIYDLTENGQRMNPREYYFTFPKNEDQTEIGFFHNKTGEWDSARSEELLISFDELSQIQLGMIENVCKWDLIPFLKWSATALD